MYTPILFPVDSLSIEYFREGIFFGTLISFETQQKKLPTNYEKTGKNTICQTRVLLLRYYLCRFLGYQSSDEKTRLIQLRSEFFFFVCNLS